MVQAILTRIAPFSPGQICKTWRKFIIASLLSSAFEGLGELWNFLLANKVEAAL